MDKIYLCYACENGRTEDCSGWCGVKIQCRVMPDEFGPIDWRGFEDCLDLFEDMYDWETTCNT
jgi:hypothetical protein